VSTISGGLHDGGCGRRRRRGRRIGALSLVEIAVGMGILSVALIAIISLRQQLVRQDYLAELTEVLDLRLRGELDLLASLPWPELSGLASDDGSKSVEPLPSVRTGLPQPAGLETLLVEPIRASVWTVEPGLLRLQVEAQWVFPGDEPDREHRVVLQRLVSRPDLSLVASSAFGG
jgi:hypothetical protein